jgi:hypothetical protein
MKMSSFLSGLNRRRYQLLKIIVIISCAYRSLKLSPHQYLNNLIASAGSESIANTINITQTRINVCAQTNSALNNVSSWPGVIYHKDLPAYASNGYLKPEENEVDKQARLTIQQFNQLRKYVLTSKLFDSGYTKGDLQPAQRFAKRLLEATATSATKSRDYNHKPLVIAVFGNSFTIGANCGESLDDVDDECAWPNRLKQRMEDFFLGNLSDEQAKTSPALKEKQMKEYPMIEWKMLQANGQNSGTIAQLLPSFLHDFQSQNITPDAILLDNTIGDKHLGAPWFEAIIRVFMQTFPNTVIVSIVDATRYMVEAYGTGRNYNGYPLELNQVQGHYKLEVIDIANMVMNLSLPSSVPPQLLSHPIMIQHLDTSSKLPDLLWPQSTQMISGSGKVLGDGEAHQLFVSDSEPVYFHNFLPRVQKFKMANYPNNHPPWPTHQYVADAVMHGLLKVWQRGLECESIGRGDVRNNQRDSNNTSLVPADIHSRVNFTESVASKEALEACFICLSPLTRLDAKSMHQIANFTSDNDNHDDAMVNIRSKDDSINITPNHDHHPVMVTCGDWNWVTDERNRSGWQSDQFGSVIRFRLKVSDKPTVSLTYMKSYDTFGDLRVTFRPVMNDGTTSILKCGGAANSTLPSFQHSTLPSLILAGRTDQFSLWETVVFPYEPHKIGDLPKYWELLNRTVLSLKRSNASRFEYVDLYIENPNVDEERSRIKVQTVTSC